MSDLVEAYAREYAQEQRITWLTNAVQNLMKKCGMALGTALDAIGASDKEREEVTAALGSSGLAC